MKILALDAMGVIYSVADDVVNLLCPFIEEKRGICDRERIETLYRNANLGRISTREFWEAAQIDPALEDEYLARHRLSVGILEFLQSVGGHLEAIWCVSNDVAAWSRKLRDRFELTKLIHGFVISGDVGFRKPDRVIFEHLLQEVRTNPAEILFVDDRIRNLDAAAALGTKTVLFATDASSGSSEHRVSTNFQDLSELILQRSGR